MPLSQLFLGGLKDGELPTKLIDLVVKADVQGSAEALSTSLGALEAADDKLCVRTRILRSGAGSALHTRSSPPLDVLLHSFHFCDLCLLLESRS